MSRWDWLCHLPSSIRSHWLGLHLPRLIPRLDWSEPCLAPLRHRWKSLALLPLIPCLGWLKTHERLWLHLPASIHCSHWLHLPPLIPRLDWSEPCLAPLRHRWKSLALLPLIPCLGWLKDTWAAVAASTSVDPLFTLAASAAIDPSFGLVRAMSGTFEASLEESGAAAADPLLGLAEDTWAAVAASTSVDPLFTLAASAAMDPSFGLVRAMSCTFEASLEESGAAAADPLLGLAEDTWAAVAASTSVDPSFTFAGAASAATDRLLGLAWPPSATVDSSLGAAGAASAVDSLCLRCFMLLHTSESKKFQTHLLVHGKHTKRWLIRGSNIQTHPRWMELLGSTAPIPANMLAERVGTKTESHGLETWPQPQKYSQSRKSTSMFPWLKTRGCEVTLHLTTYMFQVAEIIGTWDAGPRIYCAMAGNLGFTSWLMCLFSQCCWSPLVQHFRQAPGFLAPNGG